MTAPSSSPGDNGGVCESCHRPDTVHEVQLAAPLLMAGGPAGGPVRGTIWTCRDCLLEKVRDGRLRVEPVDAAAAVPKYTTRAGAPRQMLVGSQALIAATCDSIRDMLLAKNAAYGDSAISPLRVFSNASPEEQILVRLDDKLSRLSRGSAAGEDVVLDLVGYLVLLMVCRKKKLRDSF